MEVLLVLAILGVIMAMVVPQLMGRRREANIDATKLSIKGLSQALELYAHDHDGEYPITNIGLEALLSPAGNDLQWKGPYLKDTQTLPLDAWGNPLQYEYPGKFQQGQADIWSWGPDRQNGSEDDITNWTR
jgi:general secretion pathway protein G